MTDRKIWNAVLCFAMSIVLAVPGCAANTPAPEPVQSDLPEEAGQESTLHEVVEQAAAEDESGTKEASGDVSKSGIQILYLRGRPRTPAYLRWSLWIRRRASCRSSGSAREEPI